MAEILDRIQHKSWFKCYHLLFVEKPPFWKLKMRVLDYCHGVRYADAYPLAPRYDPDIQINRLRKEEWGKIRRSLYPTVLYQDLWLEELRSRVRERDTTCCRQCQSHSRPPPSYSPAMTADGRREDGLTETVCSTDRAKGRIFVKRVSLLAEWP
jgi:hypothetical protein